MKHSPAIRVLACNHMSDFFHTLLLLGGLVAAGVVTMMCVICLMVWIAGGKGATRK